MFIYSYENLSRILETPKGKEYFEKVKRCYETEYENIPIATIPYSYIKEFYKTGDSSNYGAVYFERRKRLMLLQVLALSSDKYVQELEDVLSAICDDATWSLSAHILIRDGNDNTFDYSEIDLFASETAMYLSETIFVLKEKLSPEIINRVTYSLKKRIIDVYEKRILAFDSMKNNWASVCSCGIGITYLYIFPERFGIVKDRIFSAMERYISRAIGSDGYCSEGLSYWIYGFGFFALFFDVYFELTGERPKILDSEKVKNTIDFAKSSILSGGIFLPISDGGTKRPHDDNLVLSVINRLFNSNLELNYPNEIIINTRALGYRKLISLDDKFDITEEKEESFYFSSGQVFVRKRKVYDFFSKGGTNAEMHNHNDIGAFGIVKNGKQYIVDPGAGYYTNDYSNNMAVRYSKETFTCSSYGHSVPIVNGKTQVYGKEYFATVINNDKNEITYDLTNAYPVKIDKLLATYKTLESKVQVSYEVNGVESVDFRFISFIRPVINGEKVVVDDLTLTADSQIIPTIETVNYIAYGNILTTAYAINYKLKSDGKITFNFEF